jgi:hypothetical protein
VPNLTQHSIELDGGVTGSITQSSIDGVGANSVGVLVNKAGSGVTVNDNIIISDLGFSVGGTGIEFDGTNAPVASGNNLSQLGTALIDNFAGTPFVTALSQSQNSISPGNTGYYFHPAPNSTTAWNIEGTNAPDDLEGGAGNDTFHHVGMFTGAPDGSVFVGNGGVDTVTGYDGISGGAKLAIQGGKWVVTNGAATDTLTGIERVGIDKRGLDNTTYDLVDNFGANVGGFQSIQAAVNGASAGDTILAEAGSNPGDVQVATDNLTFARFPDSSPITLSLANGVQTVTLADSSSGNEPDVTVVADDVQDMFKGTLADLNGNTFSNLKIGDTINITDVSSSRSSFDLDGNSLIFNGDTINFTGATPGRFLETDDPSGGVDLTYVPPFSSTNAALVQSPDGTLDYLEFQGTQLSSSWFIPNQVWKVVAEGDFRHDGTSDLVTQDPNSGSIDLLFVGDGALQGSLLLQGSYWNVVGTGDFDGSGRTAIATQNSAAGQINLLWFDGTQLARSELLNGSYQHVVGAADVDGDGKTDFVTQNPNGGPLDFLFFDDENLARSALSPDSYWPVRDIYNTAPGATTMLSQDTSSGQWNYLNFTGTSLTGSLLESSNVAGLTPVQGSVAAQQFFHV